MMKKNRTLLILIVLLLVVGGLLLTGQYDSTLKMKEADFTVRDTASVTKIFMADKNRHQVTLTRTAKGWFINDSLKASNRKVEFLLSTMRRLRVKAPVSKASYNNVVTRLSSISVKVEVYRKAYRIHMGDIHWFSYEKRSKVFYVGDVTQDNLGTYMLMQNSEQPYVVYIPGFRGFVSSRFSPLVNDWRSHVLFHNNLADIRLVQLEFWKTPEKSFRVTVKDAMGNYSLTSLKDNSEAERYDTLKLLNFLTSFSDLRYESRLNEDLPKTQTDSIIHSHFLYKLLLVGIDGDTTVLKMFKKNRFSDAVSKAYDELVPVDLDRFYGYLPGNHDFVLLQYYSMDKILHPLNYYEKKK